MSITDWIGKGERSEAPTKRGSWTVTVLGAIVALSLLALALLPAVGDALPRDASKPRIVVDEGVAPDGTRYRHVVYGGALDYSVDGKPLNFRGWCKAFEWPDRPKRGGGASCEAYGGGGSPSVLELVAFRFVQYRLAGEAVPSPDVAITGLADSSVADVRVFYTDASGKETELAVDFARLQGDRLRAAAKRLRIAARRHPKVRSKSKGPRKSARGAVARPQPYGVFTAFLGGDQAARDRLADRALAGDDDPQLGHPLSTGDLGGLMRDGDHCDDRDGPFRVVAYRSDGREIPRRRC